MNNKEYFKLTRVLTEVALKNFLLQRSYDVYAIVNEKIEEQSDPLFTTFLVLHTIDFEEGVILYDVSRDRHSTFTTEIEFLVKGYVETIDVGRIDRFPIVLYVRKEGQ